MTTEYTMSGPSDPNDAPLPDRPPSRPGNWILAFLVCLALAAIAGVWTLLPDRFYAESVVQVESP